jgi:hypothetical protein
MLFIPSLRCVTAHHCTPTSMNSANSTAWCHVGTDIMRSHRGLLPVGCCCSAQTTIYQRHPKDALALHIFMAGVFSRHAERANTMAAHSGRHATQPLREPFDPSTSSGQASSGQECTLLRARFGARAGSWAGKIKKSPRRPISFPDFPLSLCDLCASVVKTTRLRAQTCPEPVSTESASGARAKPHR